MLLLVGVTGMSIDLNLVRRKGVAAAQVSIGGLVVPLVLGVAIGFVLPASLLAAGTDRVVFRLPYRRASRASVARPSGLAGSPRSKGRSK